MGAVSDPERHLRLSQTFATSMLPHIAGHTPAEVRDAMLSVLAAFLIEVAVPGREAHAVEEAAEQLARAAALIGARGAERMH